MSEPTTPEPEHNAVGADPPSRGLALVFGVIGPWGLAQLYLGQVRRAVIWMVVATGALLAGTFGLPALGGALGYRSAFAMLVAGTVVLWLGSIGDVFLVREARFRRVGWLAIGAFWIVGVAAGVGVRSLVRSYALEAFKVPSGSMAPTLVPNEHFVVAKHFGNARAPKRGELIVFPWNETPPADYVKRVIAVPGDVLELVAGRPRLNGWDVPRCAVGKATMPDGGSEPGDLFVEYLDGAAYLTFYAGGGLTGATSGPFVVAEGEVWVLGDNRLNSYDSPQWNAGRGAGVPIATLKGTPLFRIFTLGAAAPFEHLGIDFAAVVLPPSMASLQSDLDRCLAERPSREATTPPAPAK